MKYLTLTFAIILTGTVFLSMSASAQEATPPLTAADREAFYTDLLEKRVAAILKELSLTNTTRSTRVHDLLTNYYRGLKARDERLAAAHQAGAKEPVATNKDSAVRARTQTGMTHDQFITGLSTDLTPTQVETVKDLMTYGKVKFTYDGYNAIVPGLTDEQKARILVMLWAAREEAIDGGSATEKSAIFQKYKDKINEYLTAQGHDLAQAYKDWNTKQELAKKQKGEPVQAGARPTQ